MQKLFSIVIFLLLCTGFVLAQNAEIEFPVVVTDDNGMTQTLIFGLDLTATTGIDLGLGETEQPPLPPAGVFDTRFISFAGGAVLGQGSLKDIRPPVPAAYPFSGTVRYRVRFQPSDIPNPFPTITISWSNLPATIGAGSLISGGGGTISAPFVGTGSVNIVNLEEINFLNIDVVYNAIEPIVLGPGFGIAPASLNLGNALVGGTSTLPATVTNTGTAPLSINGVVSSDAQFTFLPNSFPIVVAPGNTAVFNVTFAPTSLGLQSGTLTFTHNAPNSPFIYNVQGTGVDASPIFGVDPTSWNFGLVSVGSTVNKNFVVSNLGVGDPLLVTSALTTDPQFVVNPASANIPAGGSQVFTVGFTPTGDGPVVGSLNFVHNAAGSPSSVALSGTGFSLGGLVMTDENLSLLEEVDATEIIQLSNLAGPLKALQFTLELNLGTGDDQVLIFRDIVKGSDIAALDEWVLDYQVFRGLPTPGTILRDYVKVVLYNFGSNNLTQGATYSDLLRVNFKTRRLPTGTEQMTSTLQIKEAQGSDPIGNPINIIPQPAGKEKTTVTVFNNIQSMWGDVNLDGYVDILDLILVVDHIVGRIDLHNVPGIPAGAFERADIAPWGPGYEPEGDGNVNVQDLSLIQWIILNSVFPNGVILNKPVLLAGDDQLNKVTGEAKVILHITERGIAARVISDGAIRGAQLELNAVNDQTGNMVIDSRLAGGFFLQAADLLRVLLYDVAGEAIVPPGTNLLANMPFRISNPEAIGVEKIILVNTNYEKMAVTVEIVYGDAPEVPSDYALFQNYPNPFNPTTMVRFAVPQTDNVTLKVYDMLGQEVRTLFSGQVQMGTYTVQWNGLDNSGVQMASGSYIYRMTASGFVQSKKMVLLK